MGRRSREISELHSIDGEPGSYDAPEPNESVGAIFSDAAAPVRPSLVTDRSVEDSDRDHESGAVCGRGGGAILKRQRPTGSQGMGLVMKDAAEAQCDVR